MKFRQKQRKSDRSRLAALKEKLLRRKINRLFVVVVAVSYVLTFLITLLVTQRGTLLFRPHSPQLGSVATEDITVDRDIYYVDEEATRLRQEARGKLVPPVFILNDEIAVSSINTFNRFREIFHDTVHRESAVHGTVRRSSHDQQSIEETLLAKIQFEFPMLAGKMRKESLSQLLSVSDVEEIFESVNLLLDQVMREGLADFQDLREKKPELFTSGMIELWRGGIEKEEIPVDRIITLSRLRTWAETSLESSALQEGEKSLVSQLLSVFAEENCFFDELETEAKRKKAMEEIEEVIRKLVKGQVIVRKGDIIDEETLTKITAIGESALTVNINSIAGTAIFLSIVFVLAFFLLGERYSGKTFTMSQIYFLVGSALAYLIVASFLTQIPWESKWIPASVLLPTGLFSILVSLIITTRVGIIFTVLLALLGLPIFGMDLFAFLFVLLSGISGCAVVISVEKRIDLIKAGIFLSLYNCIVILMLGFLKSYQSVSFLHALGWGIGNGFSCSILSLGFLPILEHMLNASTRFRLMELSDLNSPIFKKMLSLAPGTYNHSIMVANLAESSCTRIGANALLARVGGYYHDIGKIDQARYFIENQKELNLHDDLKPSLSAAVIKSHVKVGIEKAKEHKLPKEVIDIIAQHHGKALISYFYQRALNNGKNEKVSSDDYTYTGEWPKTKEAAVVMLADAAEAASRTLKNPSVAKLEKFLWSIIMDKFNSGELNKSNLTFNELEEIKNTFVHVLAGYFHSRIEYPSRKEEAV
jgi:putative nucleotidyltransferase with HDIG domain